MPSFIPPGKQQFSDGSGNPLSGGSVYNYVPGTTTAKATYQDSAGMTANSNPITLDSNGECTIFGTGDYRQQVYDNLGNLIWDQVTGVANITDLVDNSSMGTPLSLNYATMNYVTVNDSLKAPTVVSTDNSTNVATTAFVDNAIATAISATTISVPIYGLTLSYVSATVLGIAAGGAVSDDAATSIPFASAYTKTLGSWTAGTGNGSLDTGSIAINSWYHVYLIYNPTSKTSDVLTSLSGTAPTLPSGYTKKVRIGAFATNGSAQITNFTQFQNTFLFLAPIVLVSGGLTGSGYIAPCPTGLVTRAIFNASSFNNSGSTAYLVFYTPGTTPVSTSSGFNLVIDPTTTSYNGQYFEMPTNSSGQISYAFSGSTGGSVNLLLTSLGLVYPRGIV